MGEFLGENGRRFFPLMLGLMVMGGVLGLERSLLPLMAEPEWGQGSYKAKTLFIVSFGVAKAAMNLVSGPSADRVGRKTTLILGFALGLPVPLVIIFANSWDLVIAINVVFGASQGLIGSSLIFMMIDVFGSASKGSAVGLCECTIYTTVSIVSAAASELADAYGYRPIPFIIGAVLGAIGLIGAFFVVDTMDLVKSQQAQQVAVVGNEGDALLLHPPSNPSNPSNPNNSLVDVDISDAESIIMGRSKVGSATLGQALWALACNSNFVLIAISGLLDKTKDAVIWGLAPEFLKENHGISVSTTGAILACYTAVWGVSQLFLGSLTDKYGRKTFLVGGFLLNAVSLVSFVITPMYISTFWERVFVWTLCSVCLGFGTAAIYPTMQAAAADEVEPAFRASSLGLYRCTRDLGYAVGALSSSAVADAFGLDWSFAGLAGLLFLLSVALLIIYRNRPSLAAT